MTIRAPLATRIEPRGPLLQDISGPNRLPSLLRGQDKQFGGAGQWKDYDWPNPQLRKDAAYLLAAVRSEGDVWSNRLANLYSGADKQFRGPGQWATYDYPNPRGYEYPVVLRTWTDPTKQHLIGKGKQFAGEGQWKAYDWPNPTLGRARDVTLLTWTQGPRPVAVTQAPLNQDDWPNPPIQARSLDLLAWVQGPIPGPGLVATPFAQGDWPNPRGYQYPSSLLTWADPLKILLRGQDKQFASPGQWKIYDYPNPQQPRRSIDSLSWTVSGNSLTTVVQSPFRLSDWPVPLGAAFSSDLRGWLLSVRLGLIGTDKFFYGNRGPSYDYPNPRGYEFSVQLRGYTQSFGMLDVIPPHVDIIPPPPAVETPPGGTSHKKRHRRLKKLKERRIPEPQSIVVELPEPVEHQTLMQVLSEMGAAGFDIIGTEEEDDALVLTFMIKKLLQ